MNREQRRAKARNTGPVGHGAASTVEQALAAAVQHQQAGRLADAERLCRRVLAADSRNADALNLLGVVAYQTGRPELAIDLIGQAVSINNAEASFHSNLGVVLKGAGRLDEAVASYRRAIELRPDHPEANNSLGNALGERGQLDEAVVCYHRAIELRPHYAEAYYNLGITLKEQGKLDGAIAAYRNAIQLRPNYQEAYYNQGNALRDQRRLDDAVASYRQAIGLIPDFPDAHHNCALALLALGDLQAGWAEFEWRWRTSEFIASRRDFAQPRWRGEASEGQTLLIHAEQGFGDTIQFCRYGPLAATRGVRVIMEVQKPLVRLLRGLKGVDLVIGRGDELPRFDLHCPMLSMPMAFGTIVSTIPAADAYLRADVGRSAAWRERLATMAIQGTRVGLVWAGKPSNMADPRRSIAVDRMAPLFGLSGVRLFSLQKDGPKPPAELPLIDVMDEMNDFADTAALIANLDLVISVDTAVAHLAAALGKPVWLLDRFDACWRWLVGRRDSPWYPGLSIYRQPRPDDWDAVLAEVVRDLSNVVRT
jgi:Flp pilus assembly protein TadD